MLVELIKQSQRYGSANQTISAITFYYRDWPIGIALVAPEALFKFSTKGLKQ